MSIFVLKTLETIRIKRFNVKTFTGFFFSSILIINLKINFWEKTKNGLEKLSPYRPALFFLGSTYSGRCAMITDHIHYAIATEAPYRNVRFCSSSCINGVQEEYNEISIGFLDFTNSLFPLHPLHPPFKHSRIIHSVLTRQYFFFRARARRHKKYSIIVGR